MRKGYYLLAALLAAGLRLGRHSLLHEAGQFGHHCGIGDVEREGDPGRRERKQG